MATNPMQKKARNSFILGVLITFIIMALIVAYLFLQMKKLQDEQAKMAANYVKVCILKSDVVSGQIITSDLITTKEVDKNTVPSNGTATITNLTNYFLFVLLILFLQVFYQLHKTILFSYFHYHIHMHKL